MNIIKFKKNAVLNIMGLLLPTLIFLILTPVMIDKLGTTGFGIIALVQLTTGYMNILNLGFSEAIIKHIAENIETDIDQAMRVMWLALCVFLAAGLLGSITITVIAQWLSFDVLEIPDDLRTQTVTALRIGAGIFFLQMIAEFYRGCALGCHRFDIPNISRIVRVTLSGVFILYVLNTGGGIVSVMIASLLGLAVGLFINIAWMQRAIPLRIVRGGYKGILGELFHFTKYIFATRFCGTFNARIPQFVLGSVLPVGNVAFYDVLFRAGHSALSILTRILQVFYPGFSAMDKETRESKILSILLSVMSIQLFLITPIALMVILEGHTLLAIWIDGSFSESADPIILFITLSFFLRSLNSMPTYCAMSLNTPWIISKYEFLRLLGIAVLIYPLVKIYGLQGAAATLFLTSLLNLGMIYETSKVVFKVNIFQRLTRPFIAHGIISALLYSLYNYWYLQSGWYTPYGVLVCGMIYWFLAAAMGTLTPEDSRRFVRLLVRWK